MKEEWEDVYEMVVTHVAEMLAGNTPTEPLKNCVRGWLGYCDIPIRLKQLSEKAKVEE